MNHEKVIILPCSEPDKAIEIYKELIYNEPDILFNVLGTSDKVEKLIELGSKIAAGFTNPAAYVVWITDPSVVKPVLDNLFKSNSIENIEDNVAFMLSITDRVVDVITIEDKIDLVKIFKSFQLALNDN